MPILLSFFTSGWMRWAVLSVIVLAALGFIRTHLINEGRSQVLAENRVAAAKIVVKQGAVSERVVIKYKQVESKTEEVVRYVDREVVKYAEHNTGLCLDAEWRVLHDRAANAVPDPTGRTDAASGAPSASAALETIAENYGRANRTADRLDALQQWVSDQGKVR